MATIKETIINKFRKGDKLHKKILIVLTSHDQLGESGKLTGWYLPEFAHPYYIFKEHGFDVTVISPKGGKAPLDPSSVELFKEDAESTAFLSLEHLWSNTGKLEEYLGKSGEYDALFYPGGHGPVFDLPFDENSKRLINEFWEAGKPVAAVCHGPAVFSYVILPNGEPLVKGRKTNGFLNSEEEQTGLIPFMPFLLETVFIEQGALFEKGELWQSKVVVDEDPQTGAALITGQNPASAKGVGEAIVAALQ